MQLNLATRSLHVELRNNVFCKGKKKIQCPSVIGLESKTASAKEDA